MIKIEEQEQTKRKLQDLKEKIKGFRCQEQWNDFTKNDSAELQKSLQSSVNPASQSASLNKAFIQSGSIGLSSEECTGGNSKLEASGMQRNVSPLNESQMKQYFGSNYNSLSVTQREKIVYSIINKSGNIEAGGDVKLEDLLNESKCAAPKENAQPKTINELLLLEDSQNTFPKELSPISSPCAEKNAPDTPALQCVKNCSPIQNPPEELHAGEKEEKVNKDDTLEISFKDDIQANEEDTLKDILQLNDAIVEGDKNEVAIPAIDSLELSGIAPQPQLAKEETECKIDDIPKEVPESEKQKESKIQEQEKKAKVMNKTINCWEKNVSPEQSKEKTFHPRTEPLVPIEKEEQQSVPSLRAPNARLFVQGPVESKISSIKETNTTGRKAKRKIRKKFNIPTTSKQNAGEENKVFALIGGQKVTLIKKNEQVNQTMISNEKPKMDISYCYHNKSILEGQKQHNPRLAKKNQFFKQQQVDSVKLPPPNISLPPNNLFQSKLPGNSFVAERNILPLPKMQVSISDKSRQGTENINKSFSEFTLSSPKIASGINPVASAKLTSPPEHKVRFNAFALRVKKYPSPKISANTPSVFGVKPRRFTAQSGKRNPQQLQRTPQFSSKGNRLPTDPNEEVDQTQQEISRISSDCAPDLYQLKAINTAITRIIEDQQQKKPNVAQSMPRHTIQATCHGQMNSSAKNAINNSICNQSTIVNINIQKQTDYKNLSFQNNVQSFKPSNSPQTKVTKKIISIKKLNCPIQFTGAKPIDGNNFPKISGEKQEKDSQGKIFFRRKLHKKGKNIEVKKTDKL